MNYATRRLRLLAGALCLGASLLAGCSPQEVNQAKVETNLVNGALPKARLGDTRQARIWADRAIAVDPTDPDTYARDPKKEGAATVAQVFGEVGDDPTLIDYMKQGQVRFPDNRWILATLADAQGRAGDVAGRKATAARLMTLLEGKISAPGRVPDQETMSTLADAYWASGNEAKAIETYTRLVRLYGREPGPMNNLAYGYAVHDSKPHLAEALGYAKRALQLATEKGPPTGSQMSPDEYNAIYQDTLGWVQYRMHDYKGALLNLQQASGASPREAETRYHLGMVYKALGNTDAARVELTHATLLTKGYADAARELEMLSKAPATAPTSTAASG